MTNNVSTPASCRKTNAHAILVPAWAQEDYPNLDDMPITLARAKNSYASEKSTNRNFYKNDVGTWGSHREKLMETRVAPNGDKNMCSVFCIGENVGRSRKKEAIKSVEVFVLDIDSGGTLEESVDFLRRNHLEGVVVPSYSYGKSRTTIRVDDYKKWAIGAGLPPDHTSDGVKTYLLEKKKLLPRVLEEATVLSNTGMTEDGIVITISHPPLEKHRVVLPQKNKIIVPDYVRGSTTQKDVIDAYAVGYIAAADSAGLAYDAACSDISRMFYDPYSPEYRNSYVPATHVRGLAFDFLPHFEKALQDRKAEAPKKAATADKPVSSGKPVDAGLKAWAGQYGKSFKIATALQKHGVAPILGEREKGGLFIECPFEEEHSGPSAQRTFVIDGNGGANFIIHCSGNACKNPQRDRLEFFAQMVDLGWITREQMADATLGGGPVGSSSKADVEARVNTLAKDSSDDDVSAVLALLRDVGDALFTDRMIDRIAAATKRRKPALRIALKTQRRVSQHGIDFCWKSEPFKEQSDRAKGILINRNDSRKALFRMGGHYVRLDEVTCRTETLTQATMRHELNKVTRWGEFVGEDNYKHISCPTDIASDILADESLPFPELRAIADAPFFDANGSLVLDEGYHEGSKIFHLPKDGLDVAPVSLHPSPEEVGRANALILDEALVDFPFKGSASRAHMMALVLQPFCRELIDGATPIYLIQKPVAGTGAGLLMDTFSTISFGTPAKADTEKGSEDEWRKSITAGLMSGNRLFFVDNIHHEVKDKTIASAVTSGLVSDRILGRSEYTSLPVSWTWVMAGNGVTYSEEIGRRMVMIRIDAEVADPTEGRSFKHDPLIPWVKEHRADLVWAALTLIQAWIAAGKPKPSHGRKLASFEAWSHAMGGILETAGVDGFLSDRQDIKARVSDDAAALKRFVELWARTYGDREVSYGVLEWNAEPSSAPENLCELLLCHQESVGFWFTGKRPRQSWHVELGKVLRGAEDRVFDVGTLRIRRTASKNMLRLEGGREECQGSATEV